jgi:hypothetical protein
VVPTDQSGRQPFAPDMGPWCEVTLGVLSVLLSSYGVLRMGYFRKLSALLLRTLQILVQQRQTVKVFRWDEGAPARGTPSRNICQSKLAQAYSAARLAASNPASAAFLANSAFSG